MTVDGVNPVTGSSPGVLVGLDLTNKLHIGGIPDSAQYSREIGFTENFAGVLIP